MWLIVGFVTMWVQRMEGQMCVCVCVCVQIVRMHFCLCASMGLVVSLVYMCCNRCLSTRIEECICEAHSESCA
jgi:hypothetical protein